MAFIRATSAQIELFLKLAVEQGALQPEKVPEKRAQLKFQRYEIVDRAIKRINSKRQFDRKNSPASEKQLAFIKDLERETGISPVRGELSWTQASLRIQHLLHAKQEQSKPSAPVIDIFTKRRVS